jgi:hypothetical protein
VSAREESGREIEDCQKAVKTRHCILAVVFCLCLTACSSNDTSNNNNNGNGNGSGNGNSPNLTIGGTVSGLEGSGLALQDNHVGYLAVNANGAFTFANTLSPGDTYNVNVLTQPSNPTQVCSVVNGSGTANGNVNDVQVNCGVGYTIGGTVSGLTGSLSLNDNGGDTISVSASGAFTFDQPLAPGSTYSVTVLAQPTEQTCIVTNGSGTVANSNVTDVQVACTTNTYSISGTVYGLSGSGLVLQNNGGDNLSVSTNGSVTFPTSIPYGSPYVVTVQTQPSNPSQVCRIPNGAGTAYANVTGIQIVCTNGNGTTDVWTWESGSNQVENAGSYGSLGVAAPTNLPPSRGSVVPWKDNAGNFWFFGGTAGEAVGYFNDLWEYSAGEWTWMSGSNSLSQAGSYGTLGVASPSNIPQARGRSAHWTDSAGNFWLFGGFGYIESTNLSGRLSDLWKYSGGEWTWVGGPQGYNQPAVYGTMGTGAPGNIPGARHNSVSWTDAAGNFWLYGGFGTDSTGATGDLNDIWRYDGTQWTWVGGSNLAGESPVYGTQGTPSSSNTPGGRDGALVWIDSSGDVWLFGGETNFLNGSYGYYDFNDLWEYSGGEWIWVGGSNIANQGGSYGVLETASSTNIPGARDGAVSWTDSSGHFWLLGGEDNTGSVYNDLWEYSTGEWAWISGADVCCQPGVYGTLGTPALTNVPGARYRASSWIDSSGNLWLFGGTDSGSLFGEGEFNDLWRYQP